MDAAVLGDRLPEVTQKPFHDPGSLSLQCRHWESSKVLTGLAFCEMPSQYLQSAFWGLSGGGPQRGQQQSATQTLRVHLLGIESGTFRNLQALVFSQKYRRYKWEAYCGTNRIRIAVQIGGVLWRFPFSKVRKPAGHSVTNGGRSAVQIGGVLPVLVRQQFPKNSTQEYPQYCWEFHDRLWEALSGTTSEKRSVPSRTGGERILEMLWSLQMPWIIGFGGSQPYSRGEFQETLWERFRGLSGIFGISSRKSQPYWGCGPSTNFNLLSRIFPRTSRPLSAQMPGDQSLEESLPTIEPSGKQSVWRRRPRFSRGLAHLVKAGSLQCGFWPRNYQIPIRILPWIFWWIFSSYFVQAKRPEKIHETKSPTKFTKGLCSEKFPSDFCRSLLLTTRRVCCESWLAFWILEPWDPPAISCSFLPRAPRKPHFSAKKVLSSAGKGFFKTHFLQFNSAKNHEW